MTRKLLLTITILFFVLAAKAQFTSYGKIEFERKVNIHRQMDDMAAESDNASWVERFKSQAPKFSTSYFDLYFNTNKVIYKPGRESDQQFKMFGGGPAAANTVLTDFNSQKVMANKQVYDQKFYITDSMRVLKWKITDEIRTICNYKCRKAVSKICDSVYVVAFYTEDIVVSGGPEMFSGLPGMILELAVPRLYTTWVATKVELTVPKETDFELAEKGKKASQKEMVTVLQESFKQWGKMATRNIWWCAL